MRVAILVLSMLTASSAQGQSGATQTGGQGAAPAPGMVNPSGQIIVVAGQAQPTAVTQKLTDKQRALADETDKLLEMATELNSQVGLTNKNILSIKVVRKAEEIELYARRMKGEARGSGGTSR